MAPHTLHFSPPQALPPFTPGTFQAGCSQFLMAEARSKDSIRNPGEDQKASEKDVEKESNQQPKCSEALRCRRYCPVSGAGRQAPQTPPLTLTLTELRTPSLGPQLSHLSQTSKSSTFKVNKTGIYVLYYFTQCQVYPAHLPRRGR